MLGDLVARGFDCRWGVFSGRCAGAPIERERVFIAGTHKKYGAKGMGDFQREAQVSESHRGECPSFWSEAPPVSFGVEHGLDSYVDQVSAIGNGQIPIVAATAWRFFSERAGL